LLLILDLLTVATRVELSSFPFVENFVPRHRSPPYCTETEYSRITFKVPVPVVKAPVALVM
jgi:hypothetical protein